MKRPPTSSRKQEHVRLVLSRDVSFRAKSPGFERWDFLHNALPELSLGDIDTAGTFLGKPTALPFIVSSMTGGYGDATRINRGLAEVCATRGMAMGVGSQRQAMEDKRFLRSFSVVREVAPAIPVFGNLGAAEVARLRDASAVAKLAKLIRADGFAVHLNPLQEFLQPEGNTVFTGVLKGIELLVRELGIPIIVKEIGAGISAPVARRLIDAGVRIIDVAGAGGTSWAGVEILRRGKRKRGSPAAKRFTGQQFWDWGIPTVDALRQVAALRSATPDLVVIGSGGLRSGLDAAKAIAFGADAVGAARPMIQTLGRKGVKGLLSVIEQWETELRGAMFLTGSRTLADLRQQQLVLRSTP